MQERVNVDQIMRKIDKLDYSEKLRLMDELRGIIHSTRKRGALKKKKAPWIGCLAKDTHICGDIVSPVMEESRWEAFSE